MRKQFLIIIVDYRCILLLLLMRVQTKPVAARSVFTKGIHPWSRHSYQSSFEVSSRV